MAVIIHQIPQDFQPSDNQLVWTFSSDQTAQANFYYLITTYVNNVEVQQDSIYPQSGIYAKFDASIIAARLTNIPLLSDSMLVDATNNAVVKIDVTERFGDPIVDGATLQSANVTVFKGKLDKLDFQNWDYTTYQTAFLTQFPAAINPKVRLDEQVRLLLLNETNDFTIIISTFNSLGLVNSDSLIYVNSNKFTHLNMSPQTIIDDPGLTLTLGDFQGTAENPVLYYTVELTTGMTVAPYRFDINERCRYRKAKRIHFITKIGSIESLSCDLISTEDWTVEGKGYEKKFGELIDEAYMLNVYDGTNLDYIKTKTGKIMIQSDWLIEDLKNWFIKNCYDSPIVWIENSVNVVNLQKTRVLNAQYRSATQENDYHTQELVELSLISETSMVV